ncbi:hypothetical protein SISSUDRAFT_1061959 [Sistotremastrum suecicum HHB10207 ss-3]|uniref:DRBM domain-containing protein n=1 Tax=Sistotremastrum suecicum HHB10207 ss-3 TaxID=1314776 RepID=A0A166DGM7_9AGAM|nr:hypothetical protein SISSUDRAFT_1061959 [Sistotremastrum suecicum HHB10207 ss-3]
MPGQTEWQRFQALIRAHQFQTDDYLNKLNELAQQNHINLTWNDTSDGPSHDKLWQSYPTVGGEALGKFLQAAANRQAARGLSAREVYSQIRGL